jgi:N-acetylglucosamine kinase-like BadF-type ATPase
LGDEGSAYWIGREVLRHILAHRFDASPAALPDPHSPGETLVAAILQQVGANDVADLLSAVHAGAADDRKARIASLARVVTAHVGDDALASYIVREVVAFHLRAAVELVASGQGQRGLADEVVVLGGGVWSDDGVRRLFERAHGKSEITGAKVVYVDDVARTAGEALARAYRERRQS